MYKINFNKRISQYPNYKATKTSQSTLMLSFFSDIPKDYLLFSEYYGQLNFIIDNIIYFEIWGFDRCIGTYQDYLFDKYIKNAIPIGGDGGDNVLIYYPNKINEQYNLYLIGMGNLDENDLFYVSNSISNLLERDESLDKIMQYNQ